MEAPLDPLMAVRTAHPLRDPTHPLTAAQGAQGMGQYNMVTRLFDLITCSKILII